MKNITTLFYLSTLLGLLSIPGQARAEDAFFLAGSIASDEELATMRGAAGTTINPAELSIPVLQGVAVGNTTNGGITGNNAIADSAFTNSNGVSLVVQNSGNNAVINAALVVNLSIQ